MNQVTTEKTVKRVREIENIAKKKLPRTKRMRDGAVEGITLIWSSSAQLSADPMQEFKILGLERVEPLGIFGWIVRSAGDMTLPWASTWAAGVGSRSPVTIDEISGLLPPSMLEGIEISERRDCCCFWGEVNRGGWKTHIYGRCDE